MAEQSRKGSCTLRRNNIEPLGRLEFPVVPGKAFARLLPDSLPERMKGEGISENVPKSANLIFHEDGSVSPAVFGMVADDESGLHVVPLWTVSDNALSVMMDFHPEDCFGTEISAKDVFQALRNAFPEVGVDKERFRNGIAEARKNKSVVRNISVAHGLPPNEGCDGVFRMKNECAERAGEVREDGCVDYRERGGIVCAGEGDVLAELIPPTRGTPGRDVDGKPIPARNGEPLEVKAGKNVSREDAPDGRTIFKADQAGVVFYTDGTLSVSELMEVESDVDMSTGNVHAEKGSIRIKGAVITGSTVTACDNVVVDDVVESASIKAGGDVVVGGGVIMDEGAVIEAGGNVRARFMRNATIRAGGDVEVDVDMVGCDIIAGGKILALSDKGALNGGRYECGAGLDVMDSGCEAGVPTELVVSTRAFDNSEFEKERAVIDAQLAMLERLVGTDDSKGTLLLAPKEDRLILFELFKGRRRLFRRMEQLEEEEAEALEAQGKALGRVHLKVRRTAHPGTSVTIAARTIALQQAEQASKFHWDPETGGIGVTGV